MATVFSVSAALTYLHNYSEIINELKKKNVNRKKSGGMKKIWVPKEIFKKKTGTLKKSGVPKKKSGGSKKI